jgi:catechol 2,3-dioxygenase-like lactoylglutathione lyase family enzyme
MNNNQTTPSRRIAHLSLLVRDYDEAIAYYTRVLGFSLVEDRPMSPTKRWVTVSPGPSSASLLLAKAASDDQASRIGNQTGGRVFLFLATTDFAADYAALQSRGVRFLEPPRYEPYGTVVTFADLYGNKWDLIQYAAG